ncbi:flavin reductase family protein [Flexithrix dorotheae]|uniref:flavin reductase family protein n=1 Tax=Flexithrix dorotheae TaxID=70993 RepID=UPI000367FD9A|nr:flavin reductase [Flexithrix dorotheae]
MHLTKKDIENTERIKRLNIINSVSGIKPANLIGTKSKDGYPNLGIFSSVVHLGSSPALLGFIMRPQHEKPRDTYLNIKESGFYTINHVHQNFIEQAHFTSAKFPKETSEFEVCEFTEEYLYGFQAPFVKESPLKIGMKLIEEIPIQVNKTILMIGEIQHISIPENSMDEQGHINLTSLGSAGISGVNSYYELNKINQFPYTKANKLPRFEKIQQ